MNAIRIHRVMCSAIAATLCALALGGGVSAQEEEVSFIARRNFRVEGTLLAVGDFNGDRHQDVVTARSGTVSILLANWNGSLRAPIDVAVGGTPGAAAVGDFNRDGNQDLATANSESGTVSIVLGGRDGNFRPAGDFSVGGSPNSIAVGDFNGDGRQDLATANGEAGTVSVLLGLGNGNFRVAKDFAVGTAPYQVTVGDFNGDGHPDLAVANSSPNTVFVLLGRGNGTFRLPVGIDMGEVPPTSIAMGDFNRDGRQDLAVSGWRWEPDDQSITGGTTSILLATRNGTFRIAGTLFAVFAARTAGDFNGDGHLDLATEWYWEADWGSGSGQSTFLGQGDGTFRAGWSAKQDWGLPFAGDFDADGRLDLALDNFESVSILRGNSDGSFEDAREFGVGGYVHVVRAGDFNGDGRQDVAMTYFGGRCNEGGCSGEELVGVLSGGGSYSRGCPWGWGTCPADIAVGDFNGDGRQDLALHSGTSVSVYLGEADGSLLPLKSLKVGRIPTSLTVGDFNGDGRQDLVAVVGSSTISILLGRGDGTFRLAGSFGVDQVATSLTVGDFNRDGRADLATANGGSNTVSILLSRGDGTFQRARDFVVGQAPAFVAVGDFNGDGRVDLATAGGNVSVLLGNGDGTFQGFKVLGAAGTSLTVADFNADGHQDLAAGLSIFLGRGNGTFQSAKEFGVDGGYDSVAVADFNGDGLPDLVTNTAILINNTAIKVAIDILPGSSPNQINPNNRGTIPVAIRTSRLFDAKLVDPATVRFGANGTEAPPVKFELRDIDGDFDMDLVLSFQIPKTGLRCGYTTATLRGKLVTGEPFRGSDSIQTVGCPQISP